MKKISILALFLVINILLTAQSLSFSDSISWQSNKTFIDNDKKLSDILYFKGAYNRSVDNLPVYLKRIPVYQDVEIVDISIKSVKYEVINKDDFQRVNNVEKSLGNPEILSWVSDFRKQKMINVEIIPLRKNLQTGELERIIYFECDVKYRPINSDKRNKSYTYNSGLSTGNWRKIKVSNSGIYKISYSQLVSMGFSNMNNIGVFGYGGLLPKIVGQHNIDDLPERAIHLVDVNSNGSFDNGDYLLFYADGPHNKNFSSDGNFSHEYHSYSEYSYYFISDQGNLKQPTVYNQPATFDYTVTKYDDYQFLEKDSLNLMKSGRNMFWREFDYYLSHNLSANYPNVSLTDTAYVTAILAAKSSLASYFTLYINGMAQDQITINSVSGSATDWYARNNTLRNFKVMPTSDNFDFLINYTKTTASSRGWLDYISVKFKRQLKLHNSFVQFREISTVGAGNKVKYNISSAISATVIWDITDRINPNRITGNFNSGTMSFNANADDLREYIAFNPDGNFPSVIYDGADDVGIVQNQNLHALNPADLIIITHPDFMSQAQSIKNLHEQYDGLSVIITTPGKIYNEFSSGTPDVSAFRNFMKMLYDRAETEEDIPQNLLLIGDGSYDNLSKNPNVSNFIITYQSESSLSPTSSFVSDDFFVFLDDGEGSMTGSQDIDIGVGRLPVKNASEADVFVDKLYKYYGANSYGGWKNNLLLVADDAEGGETIHQIQSNNLATQIEANYPVFNVESLFLDDFEQVSTVQGHRYPDVNQAINDYINNGVLVINWIGHGNEKGWAHESVLTLSMISSWNNSPKFPIFVTATCEFSPWDHHDIVSAGEEVLLNPNGGGIALFTTTRLAFSSSNANLSYRFYNQIFSRDNNNKIIPLGLSVAYAKNEMGSDTNKRVFSLLGNPAMRPSVPEHFAVTTEINNTPVAEFADTIGATGLVKFCGQINNPDGTKANNFNGIIYPVVYDKWMDYATRGNDGYAPLNYQAQKNTLFKGQASVTNGDFCFSFIVPVDIAYFYDKGKVSYYAHNTIDTEAHGHDNSFVIGGTSNNEINDNDGPIIELFMNNEQFIPGGITDENPLLLAKISDESGINTVGSGIGHDITLIIDENTANVIVLNKFYETTLDDFTSGEINYPLSALTLGPHTLKLKAWDVLNNSSEATTDFIVAGSSELVIEHLFNYPNPFSTNTDFYFDHNQPNVALDVLIQIFTVAGKHVKTIETPVFSDGFRSHPINWDGKDQYGDKIAKGVYVYKVKVQSPNGNVVNKFEKLVILN